MVSRSRPEVMAGTAPGLALECRDQRETWPGWQTAVFVVTSSLALWALIIASVAAAL